MHREGKQERKIKELEVIQCIINELEQGDIELIMNKQKEGDSRLNELRENNSNRKDRLFGKMSERMHIEILRHLDWKELINVREVNRGGFQMLSNEGIRKSLGNYMKECCPLLLREDSDVPKTLLLFAQMGGNILKYNLGSQVGDHLRYLFWLTTNMNVHIQHLQFGTIYIYIYINIYIDGPIKGPQMYALTCLLQTRAFSRLSLLCLATQIDPENMVELAPQLKALPFLTHLILGIYTIYKYIYIYR